MSFQPSQYSALGAVDTAGTQAVPDVPGVYMKSGVNLNAQMKGFLKELRRRTGFDIVVTSGIRTPASQASAMLSKLQRQGPQGILGLYGQKDLAQEVVNAGASYNSIKSVLERQVNRGRFISRHMRGDALDFRIHGFTPSERAKLISVAKSMAGPRNVIDEGDHVHVEELGTEWAKYLKIGIGLYLGTSLVLGAAALGVLWWYREDLRKQLRG